MRDEIAELAREDGAASDGIREEDARLPGWYTWSFVATILFALVYVPWYLFSGWSAAGQWAAEVEAAEALYAASRPAIAAQNPYRGDRAAISEGSQTFTTVCAACHRPDGSGLVGPSLVDPYWKYGEGDPDRFASVAQGRPAGMPPWATQLGTEKIWKVLAYLETLPRSSDPGMGAPGVAPGT